MIRWLRHVAVTVRRMRETPSRPMLAACGLMSATSILVATLCIVESSFAGLTEGLFRLGSNVVIVRPALEAVLTNSVRGLTASELRAAAALPGVETTAPLSTFSGTIIGCGKRVIVTIQGALPEHLSLENLSVRTGRFLTDTDHDVGNGVIVLGHGVAAKLPCLLVGDAASLSGHQIQVVGILNMAPDTSQGSPDGRVFVPLSRTLRRYGWPRGGVSALFRLDRNVPAEAARVELTKLLRQRSATGAYRDQDFEILTRDELVKTVEAGRRAAVATIFAFFACGILLAAIGVSGTVLSSVLERQAEIGISRCVGATRSGIKVEFLFEGVVIGAAGGLGGAIVGVLLSRVVARIAELPPGSWVGYALAAVLVATCCAAAAAIWPAARAASLDPASALRLER
jgi:putative ABC transport system permease protein